MLLVQLEAGEEMMCEGGSMSWTDDEIEMKTQSGGIGKMFGKVFTGENGQRQRLQQLKINIIITKWLWKHSH